LIAYTEFFKGLPGLGNALVAYLVGSTFLFGAAIEGARSVQRSCSSCSRRSQR